MYVWRLERVTGDREGVFTSGDCNKAGKFFYKEPFWKKKHTRSPGGFYHPNDPYRMPGPYCDNMSSEFTDEHYCGFESMKQYHKTFCQRIRTELCKTPTKLVCYKVNKRNVVFGNTQIGFIRSKAKVVKEVSPNYRERNSKKKLT